MCGVRMPLPPSDTELITSRYFASGTGAAGLVGAALWWEVRSLGVRIGVGVSSVRSFISFPLAQD